MPKYAKGLFPLFRLEGHNITYTVFHVFLMKLNKVDDKFLFQPLPERHCENINYIFICYNDLEGERN